MYKTTDFASRLNIANWTKSPKWLKSKCQILQKQVLRLFIVGLLVGISPSIGFTQTVYSQNNDFWLHYFGKNMLTPKLSFTLEGTFRFANGLSEKQQWFIRPSLDYQLTKRLVGSIGYTHYDTYVYGNPAINKTTIPENHLWLQGQFVHQFGDFKMINRLRDENRYVGIAVKTVDGSYVIDHFDYRNRLRYMLLLNYALLKKDSKTTTLFGIVGDEAFFNIGSNAGATFMNQNRIIAGFGYNINPQHQLQVSYIHQNIWNFSNSILENNPTARLSYYTNFSFVRK